MREPEFELRTPEPEPATETVAEPAPDEPFPPDGAGLLPKDPLTEGPLPLLPEGAFPLPPDGVGPLGMLPVPAATGLVELLAGKGGRDEGRLDPPGIPPEGTSTKELDGSDNEPVIDTGAPVPEAETDEVPTGKGADEEEGAMLLEMPPAGSDPVPDGATEELLIGKGGSDEGRTTLLDTRLDGTKEELTMAELLDTREDEVSFMEELDGTMLDEDCATLLLDAMELLDTLPLDVILLDRLDDNETRLELADELILDELEGIADDDLMADDVDEGRAEDEETVLFSW